MAKYKVGFWYTEYGYATVEAKNAKQAEDRLYKHLSDSGLDNLKYSCNDRDYGTQDAEIIE